MVKVKNLGDPSANIEDNRSGVKLAVQALLAPRQAYKTDVPDAVQTTHQHSNKMEKVSNQGMAGMRKAMQANKYTGGGRGW